MKKIYPALLLAPLCVSIAAHAQQKTLWQRDVPSGTQDFLSGINTSLDRQFLAFGSSIRQQESPNTGTTVTNRGYDFHLVKFSQDGSQVWEKYFGGSRHDYLDSSSATAEGGFILAGTSYSGKGGDKKDDALGGSDVWVIKLSEDGAEEWQKTLGTRQNDRAGGVVQTAGGGYFVAGDTDALGRGFGSSDIFVTKLTPGGKTEHSIMLDGPGFDSLEKIVPTRDGGALLGIYSRGGKPSAAPIEERQVPEGSPGQGILGDSAGTGDTAKTNPIVFDMAYGKEGVNSGEGDYWVVKISAEGVPQWQKSFGGSGDDHVRSLSATPDGFLIAGESRSPISGNKSVSVENGTDLWLVSLDPGGTELWQKSYSFGNRDVLMSLNAISENAGTRTRGYLIGGYTQAEGRAQKGDETFWMLYIDSDGREQWRKHVEGESKKSEERLASANLNPDGSYILAGTSAAEPGKENWKILKLGDGQVEQLMERQDIRVYPNPVQDFCYVEIGEDFREAEIALYDFSGKLAQSLKTKTAVTKLNTAALPQGVYIITAKTEGKLLNTKIVKR